MGLSLNLSLAWEFLRGSSRREDKDADVVTAMDAFMIGCFRQTMVPFNKE